MPKKSMKKEVKKKRPSKKNIAAESLSDVEKPFDFGGLPDRNLKKNLGCG